MIKNIMVITLIASTCMGSEESPKTLQSSPARSPFQALRASPLAEIDDTFHDFARRSALQSPESTMQALMPAFDLKSKSPSKLSRLPFVRTSFQKQSTLTFADDEDVFTDAAAPQDESLSNVMRDLRLRYTAAMSSTTFDEYTAKMSKYSDATKSKRTRK